MLEITENIYNNSHTAGGRGGRGHGLGWSGSG